MSPDPQDDDQPSAKDIQSWADQENRNSAKAFELRTKEASDIAAGVNSGEISLSEGLDRIEQYTKRWGDALYGVNIGGGENNSDILSKVDGARRQWSHITRLV